MLSNDYSMRKSRLFTIARFTLLEAWRTRFFALFLIAVVLIFLASSFLEQLAITESARIQTAFCAAALRIAAVFVLCFHVLISVVREFNDKGIELALSFNLRRHEYVLGRLIGFAAVAVIVTLLAGALVAFLAGPWIALPWAISLGLELLLMAALSLFCIMTFTHFLPAATFVAGFYLLARSLTAIRLMGDSPLAGGGSLSHQFLAWLGEAVALFVPALDRYTQSGWLVDAMPTWPVVASLAGQSLLYIVLLAAAAMFDFYRRNL